MGKSEGRENSPKNIGEKYGNLNKAKIDVKMKCLNLVLE